MSKLRTLHFSYTNVIINFPIQKCQNCGHYTFPIQKCQNCGLHFFLSGVHYIKTLHIAIQTCQNCGLHLFLSGVHYIKIQQIHYTNMPKLRTTLFLIWCPLYQNITNLPTQTCQNCGLHFFLSSVHYIKTQQIHYTNMPKLRTTLFLYKCPLYQNTTHCYTNMSKLRTTFFLYKCPLYQNTTHCYTNMSKLRTTLVLYKCPLYQNTTHCYTNMSKLRTTLVLYKCPLYQNAAHSLHKHVKIADYTFSI
jgi:hypothetical protein